MRFLHAKFWCCLALLAILQSIHPRAEAAIDADVVVYGGTPCGIAAAIGAAREQATVVLIEPTGRIGGLVTNGLSHTDFHSFESLSGAYLEFAQRVEKHYSSQYGPQSSQVRDSFRGTFAEPKVNLAVFEKFLAEYPRITLLRNRGLTRAIGNGPQQLAAIEIVGPDGQSESVSGKVFIDASYEGDLMAAAGVPYRIGREGRDEFGESLAPEQPDRQLQAYNFRFIMTRDPSNRITPSAPRGYRRDDFLGLIPILESGKIRRIFDYPQDCVFKAQTPPLPNGKYDINDVSRSIVRLSLPGKNLEWPDGTRAQRDAIVQEHLRDQVGLLYFLQNDPATPEKFRNEAREWGWCKDEFLNTGGIPEQLYVREARRMQGLYVFAQRDSDYAPADMRAVLHRDSIAMGDYGNNCHGTAHEGPRFGVGHTGEFYNPVPPYQIPYGVLVPRDLGNLLVPGAVSSTHVGFCALRLEPIWMSLGQAAGHAAGLVLKTGVSVQAVDVRQLQTRLHRTGAATIYVSDVLPGHPDFEAVQWWGTAGGLHGLEPAPAKPAPRGEKIHGQYSQAAPGHAAQLDAVLTAELATTWRAIAGKCQVNPQSLPTADGRSTRGDFVRAAFAAAPR